MCCTISANRLLPHQLQTNRGLFNAFSGQKATPEQASDMLTFRQIGTKAVQQYVTYHILQQPSSAHAPVRQHKLLTMWNVKSSRKRSTQKEKEARQVIKCLRRQLAWCNHTKSTYDSSEEQYSVLPRALADENGNPHKASKSNWSDKLERAAINLVSSWNFHHGFHRWPLWMPCLWSILGH